MIRESKDMCKKMSECMNKVINRLDAAPLFWLGLVVLIIVFTPFIILKGGFVFEIHDQLDESMMNYVLTARHLGTGNIPELLGGISASGMTPAAVLFVFLYRMFPAASAFMIQYGICFLAAFFGMYFCVKELTHSSIWAVIIAGCFALLPMYPIYGLSEYGIPLILYAWICLFNRKHIVFGFLTILLFGSTSHLIYTGYVVLVFWLLSVIVGCISRKRNRYVEIGFAVLLLEYLVINCQLFWKILFGGESFVSHKEEIVNYAQPFWRTFADVLQNSAQHAPSYHKYLILPIVISLIAGAILYKKLTDERKKIYWMSVGGMAVLIAVALFYALCNSAPVVSFKNSASGFLHYFQVERFYWIYPAGWYLEAALCTGLWWNCSDREKNGRKGWYQPAKLVAFAAVLFPTAMQIKEASVFYQNVNQLNNGSGITGYVSWEAYYAEDLMQELEDAIGQEMSAFRIAHLGISPAPALMHGFYTVDGYSNNYPLEYKHKFREVIAKELDKNEETRLYFDEWGNRCYLFNGTTGNFYNLAKGNGVQYKDLEFDMRKLKELGCEYLFAGGEILDSEKLGLEFMGYYETEKSYWGVWLYRISS